MWKYSECIYYNFYLSNGKEKIYRKSSRYIRTEIQILALHGIVEIIFWKINWKDKRISTHEEDFKHLRFSDDIVLIAKDSAELRVQEVIINLNKASNKNGFNLNLTKIKIMLTIKTTIDDTILEMVFVRNYQKKSQNGIPKKGN